MYQIMMTVLAGAALGAMGQGIRAFIGIYKTRQDGKRTKFNANLLMLSLGIGAICGAFVAYLNTNTLSDLAIKSTTMLIISSGYSGADILEGLFVTKPSDPATPEN